MVKKIFDMETEILVLSLEEQLRFYYLLEESQETNPDLSKAIQRYKKIRPEKVRDVLHLLTSERSVYGNAAR